MTNMPKRLILILFSTVPLTACQEKSLCPNLPDFSFEASAAKAALTGTWIDAPGGNPTRSASGFRINTVDLQCWKERKACVEAFAFMIPKISAGDKLAPAKESMHSAQRHWVVTEWTARAISAVPEDRKGGSKLEIDLEAKSAKLTHGGDQPYSATLGEGGAVCEGR